MYIWLRGMCPCMCPRAVPNNRQDHPEILVPATVMAGPYGPVTPMDKERRINVHFRIPYMTKWGESVVLTGTGMFCMHVSQPRTPAGLTVELGSISSAECSFSR